MKEIALMFSGGVDSTMAACLLAEQYDRVHLLTYHNGHGTAHMGKTKRRVEELQAKCGRDKFVHMLTSTKALMETVVVDDLVETYAEYRSGFIWCMGCKLAMHARSAIYCLENGLTEMSDGSSGSTQEMVEQMLVSLSLIRAFYAKYGITFATPVYDIPREEEQKTLRARGFRMGLQVLGRNIGIQPSCYAGLVYYAPYMLFHKPPKHDEALVARFIEERSLRAHALVEGWFKQQGQEVPRLAAEGAA
ncbi:MAG: 7-cyano-7-deazaguanine synthase [Deltaproteobacteria bacterium]|nr:7-cyano-7-deazaguanine synthase [Deltaproteobacteria bacterium]